MHEYTYGKGKVKYDTLEHRNLLYNREPFNDSKAMTKWRKMNFSHRHFTGEMYDMKNPQPEWLDFTYLKEIFPWYHLSWSFYKMTSGVILPLHSDKYVKFLEMYPNAQGTIGRALVMLEDWQPGHYLDIDNTADTNWKQGDYYWWADDCPHTAANIGTADRYTLQLTGFIPAGWSNANIKQ